MQKRNREARGYGWWAHRTRRAAIAPLVAAGKAICASCGKRILPGESWDLGHTDDRRGYLGPEHARCNRAKGARKGAGRVVSRSW